MINSKEIDLHGPPTSWIENLALEELNMEESGIISYNDQSDPLPYLEESSIELVSRIRERIEFYLNKFNFYRGGRDPSASVKIFKISNTVNDFMLFRNSLKLVISRKTPAVIGVGLFSNTGGIFPARATAVDAPSTNLYHEIVAHVGPFNEISWRFEGEPVNVEAMVKHYLTEFIKHSAK
ncbi:MAG: hypothetical protein HQK53_16670 [Oligoflexia bacterium]|nr:hypothetical protein [Oligoflexia bacterium]